ncbi:MAG: hypothetical protein J6A94_04875 [Lachnospiraceae bacterium]|nr:hypothetical protein [Lachnospiraceae bacterium]
MTKVIGVRFRTAGKVYFFDPLHFEIKRGDHVIVETARGIEYGTVVSGVHEVEDDKVIQPLKPVIRVATPRDVEQEAANKLKEREAYKICLEKIRNHELDMKLIDAEYTFDNNKVLFYFTADGRIDFRELVKDLASVFKTRIELRQIGVRDETKILGGIGICGRPLCCHSYLSDFVPVSIKMAKEQNLSLNPTKISGVCGRLMCCLKNEEETYEELNRRLPGIGDFVTTDDGLKGEVQSVNVLRQIVKVVVENGDEKEIRDYEVDRLQFKRKHNKKEKLELSKEEMKELERLEKEEIQEEAEMKPERRNDRRGDNRGEERGEQTSDSHNENHGESRGENRNENRGENRGENRQNRRFDRRNDRRNDKRHDNRSDNNENRESRNEGRGDNRNENRQNRKFDRRNDNRNDNRNALNGNNTEAQENNQGQDGAANEGRQGRRHDRPYRRDRRDRREGRKQENHDN